LILIILIAVSKKTLPSKHPVGQFGRNTGRIKKEEEYRGMIPPLNMNETAEKMQRLRQEVEEKRMQQEMDRQRQPTNSTPKPPGQKEAEDWKREAERLHVLLNQYRGRFAEMPGETRHYISKTPQIEKFIGTNKRTGQKGVLTSEKFTESVESLCRIYNKQTDEEKIMKQC